MFEDVFSEVFYEEEGVVETQRADDRGGGRRCDFSTPSKAAGATAHTGGVKGIRDM